MKLINTLLISILISTVLSSFLSAQEFYKQAWKSVDEGDFTQAENLFLNDAEQNGNPDSYLALAYLSEIQTKNKEAWSYLSKALKLTPNYEHYLIASMSSQRVYVNLINQNHEIIDLLIRMSESKDDGFIYTYARERLGRHYLSYGRLEDAKKIFEGMKVVRGWKVIGPFENISASGYNYKYEPEKEINHKKIYTGKNNKPVNWFDITLVRHDGWIDFTEYFYEDNSVFYANCYVYSPEKQKARLNTGTSGSLKVYLNDQTIIESFEETNNNPDTYMVETYLQEGWNKLLIKVGYSEIYQCNFMLRITDEKGFALENLQYSTESQSYKPVNDAELKKIKSPIESYFENRLMNDPDNPVNYLLLSEIYGLNDKKYESEKTLVSGLKKFPDNFLLLIHLYANYKSDEANLKAEAVSEKINKRMNSIPLLIIDKLNKEFSLQDKEKFFNTFENLTIELPESKEWLSIKLLYYLFRNEPQEAFEIGDRIFELYPYDFEAFTINSNIDYQRTRDSDKWLTLHENYCDSVTLLRPLTQLAENYLRLAKPDDWERVYNKILLYYPSDPEHYNKMANVYYSLEKYDKAAEFVKKAIEICPFGSPYHSNLGKYYLAMSKKTEARESFIMALQHSAVNYSARDLLRTVNGPEPIEKELKSFKAEDFLSDNYNTENYEGHSALILFGDVKSKYYSGGASEVEHEWMIKVLNPSGIEGLTHFSIGYDTNSEELIIDKVVAIKPDGSEVRAEVNNNEIVFSSLEVNDCIYYKYRIRYFFKGPLNQHFWFIHQFNHFYPAVHLRFSLNAPEKTNFYFKANNMDDKPTYVKSAGGNKLYVWERKDIKEIDYEAGMPSVSDAGDVLYVTTIDDWNLISDWYYDITRTKLRTHYEIENKVNELLAGKQDLTDKEKIKIIYEYIVKNITYVYTPFLQSTFIPRQAKDILVDKVGDCKDVVTLFIAMLMEIGIDANYVLVRTTDMGKAINAPPLFLFNHLIAATHLEGQTQYYELTATDYPCGLLPTGVKDALALEVTRENVSPLIIERNLQAPTIINRKTDITFNDDNSINLNVSTIRKGEGIPWFHSLYKGLNRDQRIKKMTEMLSGEFTSFTLNEFTIDNTSEFAEELSYFTSIKVNNYLTRTGNYRLFKIPWQNSLMQEQALSYEIRKFDYEIYWLVDKSIEDIKITLPEVYEPVELPEDLNISCSIADYSVKYSYDNGIITGSRILKYRSSYVPAEEYQTYKDFYNAILANDASHVLLREKKIN